jgi:CheY-like chemotaxis protein
VKVLIVDPDAARAAIITDALNGVGAQPAVAPSASFALTMLEWNRQDVIISRAQVGDMDGHELCSIVRADPSTAGVRFVLITSNVTPSQAPQLGIDLVIPEGLIGPAIVTRVMHLMRRDAEPAAAPAPPVGTSVATSPEPSAVAAAPESRSVTPVPEPARAEVASPPPIAAPPPSPVAPAPPPSPLSPGPLASPPVVAAAAVGPALKGAVLPPPPLAELEAVGMNGATRTFQGALGALSLEDLAQAIVKGTKTGRLLLVLGTGGGMIAFDGGRIVHAEVGNTTGETALQSLVAASHRENGGKFCFIPSAPRDLANVPKTITRTVAELLNGAVQAMNEEK